MSKVQKLPEKDFERTIIDMLKDLQQKMGRMSEQIKNPSRNLEILEKENSGILE